jgi:hypothetical protein
MIYHVKTQFAALLLILLVSCKAQEIKKEMVTTGYLNADELRNETKFPWFNERYKNYNPDENIINQLKKTDKNIHILIFAGDWCSDTHYLIPEYYKTTDMANITNQQLYFLDRNKKSPDKLEVNYKIMLLPTFIVIKNGVEKGRIEESVAESIEKDLLKIITAE